METNVIRAAVRKPNGHSFPTYGVPQSDGSLVECVNQYGACDMKGTATGPVYPPGSWFTSRQAGSTEVGETEDEG